MTFEDAQGPDEYDAELASRGLRKARFDPETGEFEAGAARVTLQDGATVLVVRR